MPAAVAIPLIVAAASAGGGVAAAKIQSNAAKRAAKAQTDAANHAADIQSQSSDKSLDFEKQQAAEDQRRYEEAQKLNYGQYLAKYRAAQGLGHSIGFDMPDAPGYPGSDAQPRAAAGPGAPPAAAQGGIPKSTGDVNKDLALANQLTGGNHSDPGYWLQAGYAKDPQYFFQKMLGMDAGPQDAPKMGPY